jgi:hypothetical protein
MRVRLLREMGHYKPGKIMDIDDEWAREMIARGEAMEEKSLQPAKEVK